MNIAMRWAISMFASFLLGVFVIQPAYAAPSNEFWNPFRATQENISLTLRGFLNSVFAAIPVVAGNPVSTFRIPRPSFLGFQPRTAYVPGALGVKSLRGGSFRPVPPSPITDTG